MRDAMGLAVPELEREHAELLPDRATTAAVELGRLSMDPTFFTMGTPSANMTSVAPSAEINNLGGVLPINIAITPNITIVIQIGLSGPDGSDGTAGSGGASGSGGRAVMEIIDMFHRLAR
jgi:hypothetical protein